MWRFRIREKKVLLSNTIVIIIFTHTVSAKWSQAYKQQSCTAVELINEFFLFTNDVVEI